MIFVRFRPDDVRAYGEHCSRFYGYFVNCKDKISILPAAVIRVCCRCRYRCRFLRSNRVFPSFANIETRGSYRSNIYATVEIGTGARGSRLIVTRRAKEKRSFANLAIFASDLPALLIYTQRSGTTLMPG